MVRDAEKAHAAIEQSVYLAVIGKEYDDGGASEEFTGEEGIEVCDTPS